MTNLTSANVAGQPAASVFEIFPTNGDDIIKLVGWLRAYADFPMTEQLRSQHKTDFRQRDIAFTDVLQEIYEAQGSGEWVAVETFRERNVAKLSGHVCRVLVTKNKQDIVSFFRISKYTRKLLAAIDVEYITQIGREVN